VFTAAKTGSKLKFNERVRLAIQRRTYAQVAVDNVEPDVV
jgi:tryptophanase